MNSRHLVDPALLPAVDSMPPFSVTRETLADLRAQLDTFMPAVMSAAFPTSGGIPVDVDRVEIVRDGSPPVPLLIYAPRAPSPAPRPTILHIHGGGFFLYDAAVMGPMNRVLADALNCVVASVDYRLAPETPYPGPVEDCYAALTWLHANAQSRGIDPARIGLKGDSAGGGLAAALALYARDHGGPPIAFQQLLCPMLDDRTGSTIDPGPFAGEFVWTRDLNRFGWTALLGHEPGGDDVPAYASAARAAELAGLPPTYISVGALELFLDEDVEFAKRLARAGVPVELHVYPGGYHGFDIMPSEVPVVVASQRDSLAWLKRQLGVPTNSIGAN